MTEITLNTCLNVNEVQKVVEMKFLWKLEICCIVPVPIEPLIVACSKLEELVLKCNFNMFSSGYDLLCCLDKWVNAGFKPPNLSVVQGPLDVRILTQAWAQWNSKVPADHTAHFKIFSVSTWNWWVPSIAPPTFQLEFSQNATYPFIKPSNFGLFGFGEDLMLLTNSTINGKAIHQLKEPPHIRSKDYSLVTNHLCNVTNLNFVTDFDASHCGLLSDNLQQLSVVCPNLERLNLKDNSSCLESLKGLRSIVNQCHNLQGLNLDGVHVTGVQNCIEFWELLSEIKMLNRLTIQTCTMPSFGKNDTCAQHSFLNLVQKFVHLEYLQLTYRKNNPCSSCQDASYEAYPQLLAHFPVLIYYHVIDRLSNVADIITSCKRLKYFGCYIIRFMNIPSFLSAAPNQYLQHLYIQSFYSDIGEMFMDSVSAHGKLKRVFLSVRFVTFAGITALVQNSPKLYFCDIRSHKILDEENVKVDLEVFKDTLKIKFSHRKLFNLNGYHHYISSSQ